VKASVFELITNIAKGHLKKHKKIFFMLFPEILKVIFPLPTPEVPQSIEFDLLFLSVRPLGAVGRVIRQWNANDADLAD